MALVPETRQNNNFSSPIPRVIYLDNGKALRSKFFKGTSDFLQAGILELSRKPVYGPQVMEMQMPYS